MAETTISWTHKRRLDGTPLPGYTFNPWIGCQKVSPACDSCYAEALMDKRYGRVQWGPHGNRVRTSPENWKKPRSWNRKAIAAGERPFVFCASLADVFDNKAPEGARRDLFDLIRECSQLDWLLLTKRPQNIIEMCNEAGGLPPNAALGTTVEDQQRANLNLPHLLTADEALSPMFTFVSCEPLLGPVNLTDIHLGHGLTYNALRPGEVGIGSRVHAWRALSWVITGGETDQGGSLARPSHPQWYRALRDQTAAYGIKFHHKQNGEWVQHHPRPGGDLGGDVRSGRVRIVHATGDSDVEVFEKTGGRNTLPGSVYMEKIGKNKSGRLLDGVEHNEYPSRAA